MLTVRHVTSSDEMPAVRALFEEYAAAIGIDLCFQDFEHELETLPGAYAQPGGAIIVAEVEGSLAGCVALRALGPSICEMKRLYVRPAFRRGGVGRVLAEAVIAEARRIGYRAMRLDTLRTMVEAASLYRSIGFREIEAYCHNPIEGALYFELELG